MNLYIQPPKVCQRFILKPETPHIVCMRSIPGVIEALVPSDAVSTGSPGTENKPSTGNKIVSTGVPLNYNIFISLLLIFLFHGVSQPSEACCSSYAQPYNFTGTGSDAVPVTEQEDSFSELEGHKYLPQQLTNSEERREDTTVTKGLQATDYYLSVLVALHTMNAVELQIYRRSRIACKWSSKWEKAYWWKNSNHVDHHRKQHVNIVLHGA